MKTYSLTSSLTIRQRIEQIVAHRRPGAKDRWVNVHDNGDGDGAVLGFYIDDWNSAFADFKEYAELDYRLDTETGSPKTLSLGFNHSRKGSAAPTIERKQD
jgi:hypothetical protein